MKIEVLLLCHNYQHRLCWDLSSIWAQDLEGIDLQVVPCVCSLPKNGNPRTEDVVKYFRDNGLRVKHLICEDRERFALRGYTRNDQVKILDEDTDWVLFSDCDMVYEVGFFKELYHKLNEITATDSVVCVGRWSNDANDIDALISKYTYPAIVMANGILRSISNRQMSNVGAGYFQMVRKSMLNGFYIEEGTSRDRHMFNRGLNPKSDMQFKKRFNNRKIKLSLETRQYHLNHLRDPEAGKHVENQR